MSVNSSKSDSAATSKMLLERCLTPMEAVNTLYSEGNIEISEAIVASLSRQVFDVEPRQPAGHLKRLLSRVVFRMLNRTTRKEIETGADGQEIVVYRNKLLENSGHPYALTLLVPSAAHTASFVEGGDPMNAPYMMIVPEIRRNAERWDRFLLDSIQARDVQLRFIWEARSVYELAKQRLSKGKPVRIMAAAAGTGLCSILVFDRLVNDGFDPKLITLTKTDREESNIFKINRLIGKLSTTRGQGISARVMDLMKPIPAEDLGRYHIVTLVGILEYFCGSTCITTEGHLGIPVSGDESEGPDLVGKIGELTAESGALIANTYRVQYASRILEVFGKQLRFRSLDDLRVLVATANFVSVKTVGSGFIYDVEIFEKKSRA